MTPTLHQVDPDADTLLILHYPDAPFASQSERQVENNKEEIRFQLSSKHLTLASEYFRKMMANDWKETTPAEGYSFVVTAEEWDQKALLILMNIIHGRTTKVPLTISLEMLAKVSVLVDYYKCHEAVEFFAKTWISNLPEPIPSSYGKNLVLRLCISWIFSEADIFRLLTKTVLYQSGAFLRALEGKRLALIAKLISSLHELRFQLSKDEGNCSFECSSILLGALVKGMDTAGFPQALRYDGYSFMILEQAMRNIKEPNYSSVPKSYSLCTRGVHPPSVHPHPTVPHRCTLSEKIRPILDANYQTIVGLELNAFINQS
ncbi:hypothetical protein J3E68DRAFT_447690 [Trichoderma sp. SZMC 28012]